MMVISFGPFLMGGCISRLVSDFTHSGLVGFKNQ